MRLFSTLIVLFFSTLSLAQIKNFHALSEQIYRSAAPGKNNDFLTKIGFTHVLIFKNELKGEVQAEEEELAKIIPRANIFKIPFKWKDLGPLEESCEEVLKALNYLVDIEKSRSHKILFHCTVGEDRTGALAGLYRMLYHQWNIDRAFNEEMCPHGYEAGNKAKPMHVVDKVRREVTPVFLAVASLIIDKKISFNNLNVSACRTGQFKSPTYQNLLTMQKYRYTCK